MELFTIRYNEEVIGFEVVSHEDKKIYQFDNSYIKGWVLKGIPFDIVLRTRRGNTVYYKTRTESLCIDYDVIVLDTKEMVTRLMQAYFYISTSMGYLRLKGDTCSFSNLDLASMKVQLVSKLKGSLVTSISMLSMDFIWRVLYLVSIYNTTMPYAAQMLSMCGKEFKEYYTTQMWVLVDKLNTKEIYHEACDYLGYLGDDGFGDFRTNLLLLGKDAYDDIVKTNSVSKYIENSYGANETLHYFVLGID